MREDLNDIVKQKNTMDDLVKAVNKYEELEMAHDQEKLMDQRVE